MPWTDWALLAAYIVGWLPACWVLARYAPDAAYGGLDGHPEAEFLKPVFLGFLALWWPAWAAVALFALPVWLVTRGLGR